MFVPAVHPSAPGRQGLGVPNARVDAARTFIALGLLALIVAGVSPRSIAQMSFDLPITFAVPPSLQHSRIADVDGDGDDDLAMLSLQPSQIVFALNPGSTFSNIPISTYVLPVAATTFDIADLDGDGDGDLIVATATSPLGSTILVFENGGNLSFTQTSSAVAAATIAAVRAIDADTDGDLDIVLATSNGIRFLQNDGTGMVTSVPGADLGSSLFFVSLDVVDLDGQSGMDVVATTSTNRLHAYTASGGFSFTSSATLNFSHPISRPAFADFDGDGDLDIAWVRNSIVPAQSVFGILSNNSTGGFGFGPQTQVAIGAVSIVSGDFDDDGIVDVATAHYVSNTVQVHRRTTNGTLPPFVIPLDFVPRDLVAGDLDADGDRDLVTWTMPTAPPDRVAVILNSNIANFLGIEVVAGGGQIGLIGSPYPQPLTVRLTTPTGAIAPGLPVTFHAIGSGSVAAPSTILTDPSGFASATIVAPSGPGVHSVRITAPGAHPSGITAVFTAAGPISINVVSGDNQSADIGTPFPLPLVVIVTDTLSGSPLVAAPVFFVADSTATLWPINPVLTDNLGRAQVQMTAGSLPLVQSISATTVGALQPAVFTAWTTSPVNNVVNLVLTSGDDQIVNSGESWAQPVRVRVSNIAGNSIGNIPVNFQYATGGGATTESTVLTDANGFAQTTAVAGMLAGQQMVVASLPLGGAPAVPFSARVRMLSAEWTAAIHHLQITFDNGAPGYVPIIVAADMPLAQGPIPTIYGSIATSILAPAPSLIVLDGVGIFGPPDPAYHAAPTWVQSYTFAAPPPPGFSVVLQVYGVEPTLPFPQTYFATNFTTLMF